MTVVHAVRVIMCMSTLFCSSASAEHSVLDNTHTGLLDMCVVCSGVCGYEGLSVLHIHLDVARTHNPVYKQQHLL